MTGQHTLLTIGAMALLSTVILNFYHFVNNNSDDVGRSDDMIMATSVAKSYMEIAQGMAFDAATDSANIPASDILKLTDPARLGHESAVEDTVTRFNDFDDFNGYEVKKQIGTTGHIFTTRFRVCYANPASPGSISPYRTFAKRMDTMTWRSYPPYTAGEVPDTLRMSIVMGYFHFN